MRTVGIDPSEAQVQSAILDYLQAVRILAFRMNTGVADFNGRKVSFGVQGMADILAFPHSPSYKHENGRDWIAYEFTLWIECKSNGGKQSDKQKSFQALVESHGHKYIVARSVEDVIDALR